MEGGVILQVPLVTQWPVSLATVDVQHAAVLTAHCVFIIVTVLQYIRDGTYGVILRIVKAGCHPVAIAQVVEH